MGLPHMRPQTWDILSRLAQAEEDRKPGIINPARWPRAAQLVRLGLATWKALPFKKGPFAVRQRLWSITSEGRRVCRERNSPASYEARYQAWARRKREAA